jgi:hypothetical protein
MCSATLGVTVSREKSFRFQAKRFSLTFSPFRTKLSGAPYPRTQLTSCSTVLQKKTCNALFNAHSPSKNLGPRPIIGAPDINARTYEPWGSYYVVHIWRKMETTVLKQSWTWTLKRICLIYVHFFVQYTVRYGMCGDAGTESIWIWIWLLIRIIDKFWVYGFEDPTLRLRILGYTNMSLNVRKYLSSIQYKEQ